MQLTIYGSITAGQLTLNADGVRVTLKRNDAGGWVPSSSEALETVRKAVGRELGALIDLLAADRDGSHVDAGPLGGLRLVPS